MAKRLFSNVTQATAGDAATRLQVWQWQIMLLEGCPSTRYRMAPQEHPPSTSVTITDSRLVLSNESVEKVFSRGNVTAADSEWRVV
jgi:hypothetical protein